MAGDYYSSPLPSHLCFFLLVLFVLIGFSWYMNLDRMFDGLFDQLKVVVMVSPLLLLLVVHLLSKFPLPEKHSLHRAGGTAWGVGLLLLLLLFLVSRKSNFEEHWFPFFRR